MDYVGHNGLLWPAKGPLWWKLGPPGKSGVDICPPLPPPPQMAPLLDFPSNPSDWKNVLNSSKIISDGPGNYISN